MELLLEHQLFMHCKFLGEKKKKSTIQTRSINRLSPSISSSPASPSSQQD